MVRGKCTSLAEGTDGGDVAGWVSSRQAYAAWDEELTLRAEADRARVRAEDAIGGKVALETVILAPFESELGQWTTAYQQFRVPETWRVIVGGTGSIPRGTRRSASSGICAS